MSTTKTDKATEMFRAFIDYFGVADELDGGLTLDDLTKKVVRRARLAATEFGLVWPPVLWVAEEFANNNRDALMEASQ